MASRPTRHLVRTHVEKRKLVRGVDEEGHIPHDLRGGTTNTPHHKPYTSPGLLLHGLEEAWIPTAHPERRNNKNRVRQQRGSTKGAAPRAAVGSHQILAQVQRDKSHPKRFAHVGEKDLPMGERRMDAIRMVSGGSLHRGKMCIID
jgi:hypothetical protein